MTGPPEPAPTSRTGMFEKEARDLQDRFGTRALADKIDEHFVQDSVIRPADKALMERVDMFFIATCDAQGRPQCSYKGGEPGFVRVLDERTFVFPSYDGNGMYLTAGNIIANPHVGFVFVDLVRQRRLRLNGTAAVALDHELLPDFPGAQFLVSVTATQVFANCPRYVHKYALVERSGYTPRDGRDAPVPDWKRKPMYRDALPPEDPARTMPLLHIVDDD